MVDNPGSAMCCRESAVSGEQGKGVGSSLRSNKMLLTGADSNQPGSKGEFLKTAVTSKPKSHCTCVRHLLVTQAYPELSAVESVMSHWLKSDHVPDGFSVLRVRCLCSDSRAALVLLH